MIRAVALYVEGAGIPPPELQYWLDWETFQTLPNGGGIRDQRAGELQRMRMAKRVYDLWLHFTQQREGWLDLATDTQTAPLFMQIKELLDDE